MVGYNMDGPQRDEVMKLIDEKDRIESEIREQLFILDANNVGMQDPLVDAEGFPRNDIDVYKVRHARHLIIRLRNDHKSVMKQIEQGLSDVHAHFRGNNSVGGTSSSLARFMNGSNGETSHSNGNSSEDERSFAIVGYVQEGSPADLGGLIKNDGILQFGSVNYNNFSDITQVHDVVAHSVGQPIQVKVQRDRHVICITLVPRPWAQPGLLGCQITRLN